MSVDFCQIELRVLAHLSKDPTLLSALKSSGDVFINLSSKWYKIPEIEVCECFSLQKLTCNKNIFFL